MKYHNLVYIKHPEEKRRSYLYELPLDADINCGDRILVHDKRGEHIGEATSPNFFASDHLTKTLCECNGGYYPPAKAIGTVNTVTVRQDVIERFEKEEEIFPWA